MQEMLFEQPAVQLLWLVGQAGLTMLLAQALFDERGEKGTGGLSEQDA
jgi:hypothetical protein